MPILRSFLITCALIFSSGCGHHTAGRSVLTTTIGPRTVKASVDGGGFISNQDDAAVISSSVGKIRVEKDRVLLDQKELTKISAEATKVNVDCSKGVLTILVDGAQVYPVIPEK